MSPREKLFRALYPADGIERELALERLTAGRLVSMWERARLELLLFAAGPVGSYDADGGHTKPESSAPREAAVELDHLDYRWAKCNTDKDRRSVLDDLLNLVRAYKIRRLKPGQMRGTKEWRQEIANDPRGLTAVAYAYRIDWHKVKEYRKEFGVKA